MLSDQWSYLQPLVEDGYEVIALSFSSPRKKLKPFLEGFSRLISSVISQYADRPVFMYGQSFGGYFLMKTYPLLDRSVQSKVSKIILDGSLMSLPDVALAMKATQKQLFARALLLLANYVPNTWLVTPEELGTIHIPTLVISSEFDSVIPSSQSDKIVSYGGKKFERLLVIGSGKHLYDANDPAIKDKLLEFLGASNLDP